MDEENSVLDTQRPPDGEVVLHYEQTAQPIVEYYVQPTPLPGKKKPQSAPLTPKKRRRGRKVFLVCLAVVVLAGAGITALYAAGVLGTAGGGYPGGYERYDSFRKRRVKRAFRPTPTATARSCAMRRRTERS